MLGEYVMDLNDFIVIRQIGKGQYGKVFLINEKPLELDMQLKLVLLTKLRSI